MIDAIIVAAALYGAGAPVDVALATPIGALSVGVDPVVLAGYVLSEHPGGRWSSSCSDAGACGHFQLARLWERRYDDDEPGDQRERAWTAAPIAAAVIAYSRERHEDCGDGHGWRAHMKCGTGSRDSCKWPVQRWRDEEASVRETVGNAHRWLRLLGLASWDGGGEA